jgi:hypothetical protein
MKRITTIVLFAISAGFICSCLPTGPADNDKGQPPSVAAIDSRTVYVGEPIDFRVVAMDPEGDPLSYSLSGAPVSALINAFTGLFSWRPALTDTGERIITFRASDGGTAGSASAKFTVIMPGLADTEAVRILRPAAGDTFTYGDTLTIAFVMKWCGIEALPQIFTPGMMSLCSFAPSREYEPTRDLTDSADIDGNVCRFSRRFPERNLWIGYYRLPLINRTISSVGCSLDFGGNTTVQDSIFLQIKDPYGTERNGCDPANPDKIMNGLLTGAYCRFFAVTPRP